ncbi:hypothetical protein [Thermomonospora cellulosilytica]|uniref:Secreted protein n=1 Tax=Thermomonospora cellulosilytica TaxID=1411118 RepID=A0A7W3MTC7_9ACTN|nr:hypothetical protein [Thermomonospora cellulosilytica]MBA9001535.1 hypothetical protein [Thermomonospora cellulosilytica]
MRKWAKNGARAVLLTAGFAALGVGLAFPDSAGADGLPGDLVSLTEGVGLPAHLPVHLDFTAPIDGMPSELSQARLVSHLPRALQPPANVQPPHIPADPMPANPEVSPPDVPDLPLNVPETTPALTAAVQDPQPSAVPDVSQSVARLQDRALDPHIPHTPVEVPDIPSSPQAPDAVEDPSLPQDGTTPALPELPDVELEMPEIRVDADVAEAAGHVSDALPEITPPTREAAREATAALTPVAPPQPELPDVEGPDVPQLPGISDLVPDGVPDVPPVLPEATRTRVGSLTPAKKAENVVAIPMGMLSPQLRGVGGHARGLVRDGAHGVPPQTPGVSLVPAGTAETVVAIPVAVMSPRPGRLADVDGLVGEASALYRMVPETPVEIPAPVRGQGTGPFGEEGPEMTLPAGSPLTAAGVVGPPARWLHL